MYQEKIRQIMYEIYRLRTGCSFKKIFINPVMLPKMYELIGIEG